MENLEAQTNMRCLYIQQNLIEKIENLHHCKMLAVLNLESNRIKKLENLDCLEHLGRGIQLCSRPLRMPKHRPLRRNESLF